MYLGCIRYGIVDGALRVEVSIQCLLDQIVAHAKIPVKESKHKVEGDVLIIEVVPDVESILNSVLNK
jgi:hypothetical protein